MHRIRLAVQENRLANPCLVTPASYRAYVEDHTAWIAKAPDGEVLGFAVLDAKSASIWALFVAPERERLGIGRALHETLLADARRRDLRQLWLTTAPGTRAETFYRLAGWRNVGLTPTGEIRFERDLGG